MRILLLIIVIVLFALPGAYLYRLYAKTNAKMDISFALSFRNVLLGFTGCAVFGVILEFLEIGFETESESLFFSIIAFTFGTIGVQAFIYHFMTKSVDGVRIKFKYAFIVSTMLFVPSVIPVMIAMHAMADLSR